MREVKKIAGKNQILTPELIETNFEGVLSSLDLYPADQKEGYVLYADGFQVKIKCSDFVGIARLLQKTQSFNTIARYVADGSADDLLSKLPEGYQEEARKTIRRILHFDMGIRERIRFEAEHLPRCSRKEVMLHIDSRVEDPGTLIRNGVRSLYLGKPVEILKRKKGSSFPVPERADAPPL